jgi:glycosyltransferase involved in cell wall biosynthesis
MRGLPEYEFSQYLKDCFLSVWIDETSGFGTFPLESMKTGVPVIGRIPNLQPHWMNENNGVWLIEENKMVDYTADFIQNWLEDNIKPELYDEMSKTVNQLTLKDEFEQTAVNLFSDYLQKRENNFREQLNKFNN